MVDIDMFLQTLIDKNKSPSVQYLLFNKDSVIKQYSHGFADISGNKNVNDGSTYNGFSITKTFTALAVLQLAELHKIDLDEPLKKYFPEFPYSSDITIRQVLCHAAGIPNPIPLSWIHLTDEHKSFDRNRFFKDVFVKNNKTRSKPNQRFSYSNLGYVLLGQLIEKITGNSYEAYIHENILQKLGLNANELGFEINDPNLHVKGYHKKLSFINLILGFFLDKSKYMGQSEGKWKPFKNFYVNGISYGGLIGTPGAFVKYIQELLKPDSLLLTEPYKKMMFKENHTANNRATGMCLSWFTGQLNGNQYFAHAGGGGGYYCEIRIYPGAGIGSVIFFNRTGMSDERILDQTDKIYFEKMK